MIMSGEPEGPHREVARRGAGGGGAGGQGGHNHGPPAEVTREWAGSSEHLLGKAAEKMHGQEKSRVKRHACVFE